MEDWNDYQVFAEVAQYGSFTKAADRLRLPKSTVSRAVTRLEERYAVRLLERSTRRVRLTEAGDACLAHAQRMSAEAAEAAVALGEMRKAPRGTLRVGTPVTFLRTFLTPMLPRFLAAYPEVTVHVKVASTLDPMADALDVVIRAGALDDSGLVVRKLGESPTGLYASTGYANRNGLPNTPAELTRHTTAAMAENPAWTLTKGTQKETVRPRPRITVLDPVVHHELARSGAVIAQCPHFLAQRDVAAGRLVEVLPGWTVPPVGLYALYPSRRGLTAKLKAFLEHVEEHLTQQGVRTR
jgi:DNA-binding transcriptional LysR family regulator